MVATKPCGPGDHNPPATEEFFYRNQKTGRLRSHCKVCRRRDASGWYDRNTERAQELNRRYREGREDEQAARNRHHYEQNREVLIQRSKLWVQENPEKARINNANSTRAYQARKAGVVVEHVDRMVVWLRDDGVCGICRKEVDVTDFHVDHVIPLAAGGAHSYANVQVAHPVCNAEKGARVLVETYGRGE